MVSIAILVMLAVLQAVDLEFNPVVCAGRQFLCCKIDCNGIADMHDEWSLEDDAGVVVECIVFSVTGIDRYGIGFLEEFNAREDDHGAVDVQ